MRDFFDGLMPKIQEAVAEDFRDIQKQVGDEKIYVAVLATDSDCITLSLWINTIEQMTKTDIKYGWHGPAETTKWMPDEWKYYSNKPEGTAGISKLLRAKEQALYDEAGGLLADEMYDKFYKLFIETVTRALQNLIQTNAFGLNPEEVTYFLYMTDDDRVSDVVKESAKQLNTTKMYEEFMRDSGF